MNFDGADAGIGFLIRDSNGSAIVAGAGQGPRILSALLAELHAALWALEDRLPTPTDIILEGDSAIVMGWLNGTPGSLHPTLRAAKNLLAKRPEYQFDPKIIQHHRGQSGPLWENLNFEEDLVQIYLSPLTY